MTLVQVIRWNSLHTAQTKQQNTQKLKFDIRLQEKWESADRLTDLEEECCVHWRANVFDDPAV